MTTDGFGFATEPLGEAMITLPGPLAIADVVPSSMTPYKS